MKRYFLPLLLLLAPSCSRDNYNNDGFIPEDFNPSAAVQKEEASWTDETVSEGLVYHKLIGYETITDAKQIIHVLEVDLNNPRYELKLFEHSDLSTLTTADAVKEAGAVAGINGGFAKEDVFSKVDGVVLTTIDNDYAASGIPQWKAEGAVYLNRDKADGKSKVEIRFDGKGLPVARQRAFYTAQSDENILSSAPMLIDNGEPVGENFVNPPLSVPEAMKLAYEDPRRHQTQRHPRTAIALTPENHLLMVVADGRRTNVAEGMGAAELTRFLVKHFNPVSAINLDGGGSSTMVVRASRSAASGSGVVNFPSASEYLDHTGLRVVPTHLLVMDKQIK